MADLLSAGQHVWWDHQMRGGYGYVETIPATVVKVGKRVTIEVLTRWGTIVRRSVRMEHLRPAAGT